MQNLFQDLSKKELSTKTFRKIIVKAFFIKTKHESYLNPLRMQRNCYFYATTLIKLPTTISINAFNN